MHGASDKNAVYPADGRVEPRAVLHCLGFAPDAELHDTQGRPFPAGRGSVIRAIL